LAVYKSKDCLLCSIRDDSHSCSQRTATDGWVRCIQ